jgi:hypothetical protein
MAAPGNVRITGVYALRAAGGVTGISEITSKTGISLRRGAIARGLIWIASTVQQLRRLGEVHRHAAGIVAG